LKYNRFQKSPQLRYCWVNPYSRTLHWSLQPTTDSNSRKTKSAYIVAIQWRDTPTAANNVPPTEMNSIIIATPYRLMKLQPISWEVHNHWAKGLSLLLKRTKNTISMRDQFQMMQEYQNDSGEDVSTPKANPNVEVLCGSDATMKHRRVHTMISTTALESSTPKKLKEHHRRLTVKNETKPNDNPFLISSSSSATLTPRKFSLFRK
jgi:hypothetical protein